MGRAWDWDIEAVRILPGGAGIALAGNIDELSATVAAFLLLLYAAAAAAAG
jgi:hypothetical protein